MPARRGRSPDALIRHGDQAALEELVLAKVRQAATDDSLLKCPKLPQILSLWQDLAGNAEPITWVQKMVGDDRHLHICWKDLWKRTSVTR